MKQRPRVVAIIPAYKVKNQILEVVDKALDYVDQVLVIDDFCPEGSGQIVQKAHVDNGKVRVLFHERNLGVGGAVKSGFRWALDSRFDVIVKIDGDGQMDPSLVPKLIEPILDARVDYCKGNRFASPRTVRQMPIHRLLGNGFLSLFSKASTGYWSVNDPTNGFIAISRETLGKLEFERLENGYFFESDVLFRLSILGARVEELPMVAFYGEEKSNLRVGRVMLLFPFLHLKNLTKRIIYNYYVRDWSIGSVELPVGLALVGFGLWFGLSTFSRAQSSGQSVTSGQAVATAIAIILGFQLLLSFLSHDIQAEKKAGFR